MGGGTKDKKMWEGKQWKRGMWCWKELVVCGGTELPKSPQGEKGDPIGEKKSAIGHKMIE